MSLADAFAKAGIVSQDKADRIERQKFEDTQKKEKNKIQKTTKSKKKPPMIAKSEDLEPFDKMWVNPKSRGFIQHLVWAFTPISKIDKVWLKEKEQHSKCCICMTEVMDVNETMKIVNEDGGKTLIDKARFVVKNNEDPQFDEKMKSFSEESYNKLFKGKVLSWGSPDSKRVLCLTCLEKFNNWVIFRLMSGDRTIIAIVNKIRRGKFNEQKKAAVSKEGV